MTETFLLIAERRSSKKRREAMDEKDAETTQEQGDVKYLKIFYQVKNITQEPNIWNEEMKV